MMQLEVAGLDSKAFQQVLSLLHNKASSCRYLQLLIRGVLLGLFSSGSCV